MYTERFSETHYPLASYHADSLGISTVYTAYVSLANYHRAVAGIDVGDMAGTATLDVSIVQASDTAGTGVKAITGKAMTQLTQAGGDGDDIFCIHRPIETQKKWIIIDLEAISRGERPANRIGHGNTVPHENR